jgi:twitching motility protein PilT
LRQDPDVIVVGEMRDYEAISTALTAAETGHLVIATMHSRSVLQRWNVSWGSSREAHNGKLSSNSPTAFKASSRRTCFLPLTEPAAYWLTNWVVTNNAIRNMIRENQLHQLENALQMGRKDGMMLMDNCLYDLYCKCLVT